MRFDSAKGLIVESFIRGGDMQTCGAEAIVGACLGRRETKHKYFLVQERTLGNMLRRRQFCHSQGIEQQPQKGLRDRIGPCVVP